MTRHVFDLQAHFCRTASTKMLRRAAQECGTDDLAPDVSSIDHVHGLSDSMLHCSTQPVGPIGP